MLELRALDEGFLDRVAHRDFTRIVSVEDDPLVECVRKSGVAVE